MDKAHNSKNVNAFSDRPTKYHYSLQIYVAFQCFSAYFFCFHHPKHHSVFSVSPLISVVSNSCRIHLALTNPQKFIRPGTNVTTIAGTKQCIWQLRRRVHIKLTSTGYGNLNCCKKQFTKENYRHKQIFDGGLSSGQWHN